MHTFASPLQRVQNTAGRRTAVVCGDATLTWEQTAGRCRRRPRAAEPAAQRPGRRRGAELPPPPRAPPGHPGRRLGAGAAQHPPRRGRTARRPGRLRCRVLVTDRDPGPLASLVEHVVRLDTGEYDALLADSPERWGEAVHAVAVPRSSVTVDELLAHCRELVAGYQVPKVVDVTDVPLPTSGAGKVLKRQLRDPRAGLAATAPSDGPSRSGGRPAFGPKPGAAQRVPTKPLQR